MEGVNFNPFEPEAFINFKTTSNKGNLLTGFILGVSVITLIVIAIKISSEHQYHKLQKE